MELVFLGSGGGRIVLDRQILATGGFRINSNALKMHVDPGPGALLKSLQYKEEPNELDAIFVSHCHIDHCNDANMFVEAMNYGNFKGRKGTLLGSESVISGQGKFEKQIDEYFKGMLEECKAMKQGEKHTFKVAAKHKGEGNTSPTSPPTLRATKTLHEDPSAIGFLLEAEGISIGYSSDTGYFDGLGSQFEGADFLVFNCLRPGDDKLQFHLTSIELVDALHQMVRRPKAIFITHMGIKFLQAGPESQRKLVEEKADVPVFLAGEGRRFNLREMKEQQNLR